MLLLQISEHKTKKSIHLLPRVIQQVTYRFKGYPRTHIGLNVTAPYTMQNRYLIRSQSKHYFCVGAAPESSKFWGKEAIPSKGHPEMSRDCIAKRQLSPGGSEVRTSQSVRLSLSRPVRQLMPSGRAASEIHRDRPRNFSPKRLLTPSGRASRAPHPDISRLWSAASRPNSSGRDLSDLQEVRSSVCREESCPKAAGSAARALQLLQQVETGIMN